MVKVDGFGNRYELAKPKSFECPRDIVPVHKNNDKGITGIPKTDWDRWEQVADSKVEQREMF